jgi:hypothetical protein
MICREDNTQGILLKAFTTVVHIEYTKITAVENYFMQVT